MRIAGSVTSARACSPDTFPETPTLLSLNMPVLSRSIAGTYDIVTGEWIEIESTSRSIAGTYDTVTGEWIEIESPDGLFCCGHTMTADGNVVVVGGHQDVGWPSGMKSIRLLNRATSK
eukprot:gene22032-29095_t